MPEAIKALNDTERRWVESTLERLSLRERIGQLLVPVLNTATAGEQTITEMVAESGVGGGHCFAATLDEQCELVDSVQAASKVPMLISGDLERGLGCRIPEGTEFPTQLAMGAAGYDLETARLMGEAIAVEGKAAGFNWVFGPVVDLALSPESQALRSLGPRPEQVSEMAAAMIEAIQVHGMAACAKHFPGLGHDIRDSHLTTTINPLSELEWQSSCAKPFEASIAAGVYSIMSAHVAMPALDPEHGDPVFPRPVSVSRSVLDGVLRKQLGFDGLIITDAMNMGGVTLHLPGFERYLEALNAGNDMLLFVRRVKEVVDFLLECIDDGRLAEERVKEACRRVLVMKARLRLYENVEESRASGAITVLPNDKYRKAAQHLAEKSITLIKDSRQILAMPMRRSMRVASVLISNCPDEPLNAFHDTLLASGIEVDRFVNPDPATIYDRVESEAYDFILVLLNYPPQWGWATSTAHGPYSRSLMSGFPFAHKKSKPVFVSFGNPFHLHELAYMDPYLVTWGSAAIVQEATARAILGDFSFTGISPVRI